MRGEGTRDDYIALVAQHWFIYEALEAAADSIKDDPVASTFVSDKLTRLPALEADLAFLIGPDWRDTITPLPATQRRMPPGRWRDYADELAGPFERLAPVAARLGYPDA